MNRAFDVQPDAMDRWVLPSLELNYKGNGYSVVSSSSYFYRHTHDLEDSTYGTEQAFASSFYGVTNLPNQPLMWDGERYHNQLTEELRLSFDPVHNLSGTAGAFYSYTRSLFFIPNTYAVGMPAASIGSAACASHLSLAQRSDLDTEQSRHREGHLGVRRALLQVPGQIHADGRCPQVLAQADHRLHGRRVLELRPTPSDPQENSQSGADPKVGLSYQATDAAMVYASASKGFRAGGAQANFPACTLAGASPHDIEHIKSDTLWSYEAGTKIQIPHTRILLTAARISHQLGPSAAAGGLALRLLPAVERRLGADQRRGDRAHRQGHAGAAAAFRCGLREDRHRSIPALILCRRHVRHARRRRPAWTASVGGIYTQDAHLGARRHSSRLITATRATAFRCSTAAAA